MYVRVRLHEVPLFSGDGLDNEEEMQSSSASVYALQTARNCATHLIVAGVMF
jgi:hypothetical protein